MNENNYPCLRSCNILLWILLIAPFMLLRYSESATCYVNNCVSTKCSSMTCDTCNDGYFLLREICRKCSFGCSTCTNFSKCTACADKFYLQSGKCHRCFYRCATCTNSKTCTACADKFYLQSGKCHHCFNRCATCTNLKTCTACADKFYLQSGDCHLCSSVCATCTRFKTCTACGDPYWNLLGQCSSLCSTNCTDSRCDDTTGLCYDCKPGKYGQHCEHDCNLCTEGQCGLRQCISGCKDAYYQGYTVSGNSYCLKCAQDNCITCSNGTYCSQCKQGYYRKRTSTDVTSCIQCYSFCLTCQLTELCPADCVQHCSDPDNQRNTKSTHKILAHSTSSSSSSQHTSTLKISETVKSAEVTTNGARQNENAESHEETDKFLQQGKTSIAGEDQNKLTFGHGIATGISIALVVFAIFVVLVLCIRRRTNLHKRCCGLPDDHDNAGHHYVNTHMSVTPPGHNEVEVHNVIRTVPSASTNSGVTNCNEAYYSNIEFVSLGVRSPSEFYYADSQNAQRSGM